MANWSRRSRFKGSHFLESGVEALLFIGDCDFRERSSAGFDRQMTVVM
jgi:hypothetical protein